MRGSIEVGGSVGKGERETGDGTEEEGGRDGNEQVDKTGFPDVGRDEFRGELDGDKKKSKISRSSRSQVLLLGENMSKEAKEGRVPWSALVQTSSSSLLSLPLYSPRKGHKFSVLVGHDGKEL